MRLCMEVRTCVVLCVLVALCVLLLQRSHPWGMAQSWASFNSIRGAGDPAALPYSVFHEVLNISALDLSRGEVRILQPHGLASHFFIQLGSYRLGARLFGTVGLVAQRLEELHGRTFECEWISQHKNSTAIEGKVWKIRPDFGYHRLYGTLVISCAFEEDIDTHGGSLWISASYDDTFRPNERFPALSEAPKDFNASVFQPPFPYEYVYCGSPLFGNISPQRVREWMAHHNRFFEESAHFILYDGGGIHDEVYEILRPWVELGRVSIQNMREADVYDGYYHHQFATVNDCMYRAQSMANWTFFFDLDEYLYLNHSSSSNNGSLAQVMQASMQHNVSQIQLLPVTINRRACLASRPLGGVENSTNDRDDAAANAENGRGLRKSHVEFVDQRGGCVWTQTLGDRKWMMEKLVFAWENRFGTPTNQKYAIQSRSCWGTGVHKCENVKNNGLTTIAPEADFRFYHYHDTLPMRTEVCEECVAEHSLVVGDDHYHADDTMVAMAELAKQYELETIGEQPFIL